MQATDNIDWAQDWEMPGTSQPLHPEPEITQLRFQGHGPQSLSQRADSHLHRRSGKRPLAQFIMLVCSEDLDADERPFSRGVWQ